MNREVRCRETSYCSYLIVHKNKTNRFALFVEPTHSCNEQERAIKQHRNKEMKETKIEREREKEKEEEESREQDKNDC